MHPITPEEAARNATVEAHLWLLRSYLGVAFSGRRRWVDWDDARQAGALGLMHAVGKHDPRKGAALATYARYWIKVHAADEMFQERLPFRLPRWVWRTERVGVEPPAALEEVPARAERDEDDDDPRERLAALLWGRVDGLPEPERSVLRLRYGEGLVLREIGERLGLTINVVYHAQVRAVARLRRELAGEEVR